MLIIPGILIARCSSVTFSRWSGWGQNKIKEKLCECSCPGLWEWGPLFNHGFSFLGMLNGGSSVGLQKIHESSATFFKHSCQ